MEMPNKGKYHIIFIKNSWFVFPVFDFLGFFFFFFFCV